MALIECPECKRRVSDQAQACPSCGMPLAPGSKQGTPLSSPPRKAVNPTKPKKTNDRLVAFFVILGLILVLLAGAEIDRRGWIGWDDFPNWISQIFTTPSIPPALARPSLATPTITPVPTPDPTLLQVVHTEWEKGGFDSIAIWHVTFFNRSDKPIGNIQYRTRYSAETGDKVDAGGVDALLGDNTIRKVIPPHQKRTIEINDGFLHHEAAKANFQVVSWEFVSKQ